MKQEIICRGMLDDSGWHDYVRIRVDAHGIVQSITGLDLQAIKSLPQNPDWLNGFLIPGFINAHSHSFQHLMVGLAEERRSFDSDDDFWSWRHTMYDFALRLTIDDLELAAYVLYKEMLRQGYTEVHEFHYLHHQSDGTAYSSPYATSEALCRAAERAGIRIVIVPVLYQRKDFDSPALAEQRRFLFKDTDDFLKMLPQLDAAVRSSTCSVAVGAHSLRAVDLATIKRVKRWAQDRDWPFHIHVSEQRLEVEDCQRHYNMPPIALLNHHQLLDPHSWLVHATHAQPSEIEAIAKHGTKVVLCPSTEGNLGDGIFDMISFVKASGEWTLGTDSHVGLNPFAELRCLDYAQRLKMQKRLVLNIHQKESGEALIHPCLLRTRHPLSGGIKVGLPLDALLIDNQSLHLDLLPPSKRLSWLLNRQQPDDILATYVQGKRRWHNTDAKPMVRDDYRNLLGKCLHSSS